MKNKLLYSILFLKGRIGTDIKELSTLLNVKDTETLKQIKELKDELKSLDWPLEVRETETKIRLTVNKETSMLLSEKMNKTLNVSLSKSILEALTIIAYKQPATKTDIEQIRGVSADYAISKLLDYGLIESNERSDLPGKPRLYVTTQEFLELFGLDSLTDLPESTNQFEEKTQETALFTYDEDAAATDEEDSEKDEEALVQSEEIDEEDIDEDDEDIDEDDDDEEDEDEDAVLEEGDFEYVEGSADDIEGSSEDEF